MKKNSIWLVLSLLGGYLLGKSQSGKSSGYSDLVDKVPTGGIEVKNSLVRETNNPGNILYTGKDWPGLVGKVDRTVDGKVYSYVKFDNLTSGSAAVVNLILENYLANPNYNTPYSLVGRYVTGNPNAPGLDTYRAALANALQTQLHLPQPKTPTVAATVASVILRYESNTLAPPSKLLSNYANVYL